MDVSHLLEQCLWCRKAYLPNISTPLWCFDQELTLHGSVHSSHSAAWHREMGLPHWFSAFGGDPETARRYIWVKEVVEPQEHYFGLVTLFAEPAERERHLTYWASTGYLDQDAAQGLMERVQQLEARYLERFPDPLEIHESTTPR